MKFAYQRVMQTGHKVARQAREKKRQEYFVQKIRQGRNYNKRQERTDKNRGDLHAVDHSAKLNGHLDIHQGKKRHHNRNSYNERDILFIYKKLFHTDGSSNNF